MSSAILSIDGGTPKGRVILKIIKLSKNKELPNSDTKGAWDKLINKFAPTMTQNCLKLKKKFAESKLNNDREEPEVWITSLEEIQN